MLTYLYLVLHKTVKIRWIWEMRNGLETYSDQVPKDLCKYHTGAVRAKVRGAILITN